MTIKIVPISEEYIGGYNTCLSAVAQERVELDVYASNGPALGLYEKLGFVVEGVHRRARKLDGQVDDLISMALLFDDHGF